MTVIHKKICLLGDFAVGKTSLARRFVEGQFDERYLSTTGLKISRKPLPRPYGTLNLLVWDISSDREFDLQTANMRAVTGALIVCDLTRRETVAGLERFAAKMKSVNAEAAIVFVGNKADLKGERAVSDADLQAACEALGGPYLVTSAKTGEQVEAAFLLLADNSGSHAGLDSSNSL